MEFCKSFEEQLKALEFVNCSNLSDQGICSYIVISTKIHLKNYSCYYDILKVIMITNFIFVWKLVERQG